MRLTKANLENMSVKLPSALNVPTSLSLDSLFRIKDIYSLYFNNKAAIVLILALLPKSYLRFYLNMKYI